MTETVEKLAGIFEGLEKEVYGALILGSYARGDYILGWSDIDVNVVLNYEYTIPRQTYEELGKRRATFIEETGEEPSLGIFDMAEVRIGKYSFMTRGFKDHLGISGKVLFGKDIRDVITSVCPNENEERDVGYGLWRTRITAVNAYYDRKFNRVEFVKDAKKTVSTMNNFYRNALYLAKGKPSSDSKKGLTEEFKEVFTNVDMATIDEVSLVPHEWASVREDDKKLTDLIFRTLNLREKTVQYLAEISNA